MLIPLSPYGLCFQPEHCESSASQKLSIPTADEELGPHKVPVSTLLQLQHQAHQSQLDAPVCQAW